MFKTIRLNDILIYIDISSLFFKYSYQVKIKQNIETIKVLFNAKVKKIYQEKEITLHIKNIKYNHNVAS